MLQMVGNSFCPNPGQDRLSPVAQMQESVLVPGGFGQNVRASDMRSVLFFLSYLFSQSESRSGVSKSLRPQDSPWNSPGQNTAVGSLSLLQGIFPTPGMGARSPALQADSLPAEPQGKPKNTGVGSLSLLQGIFPTPGMEPRSPALQADFLPTEPVTSVCLGSG